LGMSSAAGSVPYLDPCTANSSYPDLP